MSDEKAISIESVNSSSPRLGAVSVLVVDGDSACLAILSRMLCNLGYKGKHRFPFLFVELFGFIMES